MNFWLNKDIIDACEQDDPFGWLWCKKYQEHQDDAAFVDVAWEEIYWVLAEVLDE